MTARTRWSVMRRPDTDVGRAAAGDEARTTAFRELVFTLVAEAGLTLLSLRGEWGPRSLRLPAWRAAVPVHRSTPWGDSPAQSARSSSSASVPA